MDYEVDLNQENELEEKKQYDMEEYGTVKGENLEKVRIETIEFPKLMNGEDDIKVAILTMFAGLSQTYSLVNVVAQQLEMLLANDVKVAMIVSETCGEEEKHGIFLDPRIQWIKIKHQIDGKQIKLYDYALPDCELHNSFETEVEFFKNQFIEALTPFQVCIMHDILYQGWNYVYNIAIRRSQKKLENIRFLSFIHSFPVKRPLNPKKGLEGRYTPMEHTVFVYPSYSGIAAVAQQYQVPECYCRVVYNTPPLIEICCEEVKQLHQTFGLLDSEVLVVYPANFSPEKKFEKVVALLGTIKKVGEKTVKVVFCDAPSVDVSSNEYKEAIYYVANFYGLSRNEIVFTSDLGYEKGFPLYGVMDLFLLSNLYICPSYSETFSLSTLEAASRGNFIILNEAVPALEEIGKQLGAYFMRWDAKGCGYSCKEHYTPSELKYYEQHAAQIIKRMRDDKVCDAKTMIRKRFNPQWVWHNQLKSLIYDETIFKNNIK